MIYHGIINKRIRNIKVYATKNRIGHRESFLTKLFIRLFGQKSSSGQSAAERLR